MLTRSIKTFSIISTLICAVSLNGQYISEVSYPDTSKEKIQDTTIKSIKYSSSINAADLEHHLSILASDNFEGRETGKAGNYMAAAYIAGHYASLGIPPAVDGSSYYQGVSFTWASWEENAMFINGEKFRHLWDYIAFPDKNTGFDSLHVNEVIFLGYGIDDPSYSDYKGNDVRDKVVLIYEGEPVNEKGKSWITKSSELSDWSLDNEKKLLTAKAKGAKLVLIIENDIKALLTENRRKLLGGGMQMGDHTNTESEYPDHLYISSTLAKSLWGEKEKDIIKSRDKSKKKGKANDVKIKTDVKLYLKKKEKALVSNNIVGFIEGTDKKDEIVVVSAHMDHLGKRGDDVYNGADDNGSGTTTLLEIAEAFAMAKADGHGPRRSILCINLTGEEKGLLGSAYYAENPLFPLEQTVVDVNIDMVGRVDKNYSDTTDYIYVIGSDRISLDLHHMNESVNQSYSQLILDYTYNSEDDPNRYYYRSDHYNFAKKGIPSIFFFSGVHEDYHRITDTVEKIEFEKMEKVARHIFHLTWELAHREERIRINQP